MLSLFKSNALIRFGNLGISFPVCLAAHSQIHAYFGAFAGKVFAQSLYYFSVYSVNNAYLMLCSPAHRPLFHLIEFRSGSIALRTPLWGIRTFKGVTAN